ncbi:MAG TPA: OmpA family protein, partial [Salinivirgaceae bacterium]|nr:OmpA family protein [Salinivirgaceae bacterium]
NWSFMGEPTHMVVLDPGETKLIPIRISAYKKTIGDIGYSIVASLKDNTGKTFKNAYFYVNVPRESKIHFQALERNIYLDPVLKQARFSLYFSNLGNVDELLYIRFYLPSTLEMDGSSDNFYKDEFLLAPTRDTMVHYYVKLTNSPEAYEIKDHRIRIDAGNKDTTFKTTIWAKRLESRYSLEIPMSDRLLVVEFSMLNLFSQYDPIYEGAIWGNIHGKKNLNVEYFFRSIGANFYHGKPLEYSRTYLRTRYKQYQLNVGDISQATFTSSFGKGAQFILNEKKISIDIAASRNLSSNADNFGIITRTGFYKNVNFSLNYGYQRKKESFLESVPGVGISFPFLKHYHFGTEIGYAMSEFYTETQTIKRQGLGTNTTFNIDYPRLRWNWRLTHGDNDFVGYARGKTNIVSDFILRFNNSSNFLSGNYSGYNQKNINLNETENSRLKNITHTILIKYNQQLDNQLTFSYGTWLDYRGGNSFYRFNPDDWFAVQTSMVYTSLRYRTQGTPMNLFFEIRGGPSYIIDYSREFNGVEIPGIDNRKQIYPNLFASSLFFFRNLNLGLQYYHGPYTLNQYYSLFYSSFQSRAVRLTAAYNRFFFRKIIEYNMRGSYNYEISTKANRIGLNNEITARFGQGWTTSFGNTIGFQSTFDRQTENKYRYQNLYFELRIRKEFGFGQPSFKYHKLEIVFYKDLNGNGRIDAGEPGVDNVLVSIDKDYLLADSLYGTHRLGEFYAMEFLSDLNGKVTYQNIPTGFYTIKYMPVGGTLDKFVTENSSTQVYLDRDKVIEIPFVEKNKIFGQIIMNRSKLSNLGNIDISNIKVTATDTRGRMYSTLTDKNGKFVIYVPNIEKYIVSINNIFREHFELEQNSFEVQLNGYKQFELTFIFTEKQRRINFAQNINLDAQGQQLQTVRRTNLSGTVKDVNTLAPVKATVQIIEETNGNVVAQTTSDSRTGNFFVSYLSGNNYRLEISAEDYWFYSEKLAIEQLSTFMNLNREVTLSPIAIGTKIPLNNLTFEKNQSQLSEEAKIELLRVLQILKNNPTIEVEILGHCDDVEALESVDFSEARAKSVAKFFTENNFTAFVTKSVKASEPLINEASDEARKLNRRIEIVVINK